VEVVREQGRPQGDHHVVRLQAGHQPVGRGRQEALEERMRLGEAGTPGHRADPDGGAGAFGEGADLGRRVLVVDSGADHQRGPLAAVEACREGGQGARVRGERAVHRARLDRRGRPVPVVLGHGDEDGATGRGHGEAVGFGEHGRYVGGAVRLAARLHVRARELDRVVGSEERPQLGQGARLLAGQDDEGYAVAVRVEDGAQGVAYAARRVEADEGRAAGAQCVSCGHADGYGFL
jgi:hypothetical protein